MVIQYDDVAAETMEVSYLGHDVTMQREETLTRLKIQPGEHVLDIGAGPGFLAVQIADQTGPTGSVLGIDISESMVRRATDRNDRQRLSNAQGDATSLPVDDASFDVVACTQVAEYMSDPSSFCTEIARVLKPGGRAMILTTDWDGVAWHSEHPGRMARVMQAQNKSVAISNVPRILAPYLRNAGLTVDNASCFQITNLDRRPDNYSTGTVAFVTGYLKGQGTIPEGVLSAWAAEQDALEKTAPTSFPSGSIYSKSRSQ